MSKVPTAKLSSGYEIPLNGYGCFGGNNGPQEVYSAAKAALEIGYRHFDTAYIYRTEEALGNAIKESGVPREELFITTKLWQNFHEPQHVRPVFERSLKNLQMDYVDLYLIHWPMSWEFRGYEFDECKTMAPMKNTHVPFIDTWREMEKLVKDGKARSIGVSNFTIPMLEELLSKAEIPPVMNQVEIHPSLPQEELLAFCKSKNILLTAYSPLGNPGLKGGLKVMNTPVVQEIAKKYNKTPVQVLLNWGINRGYCVIPKSVTPSRIKDNLVCFELEEEDIKKITAVGSEHAIRTCNPRDLFGPDNDIFA